jgi:hypothetical protein
MVRPFAFLSALVIASTGVWLVAHAAESFLLFFQAHPLPKWFGRSFGVYVAITVSWLPIMIAMPGRRRRPAMDEDVPLTPVVRRGPSGMREL